MSDKRKAASRANGAKSKGPVTPQGKQNSRRKSPNPAALARAVVLQGESAYRFQTLVEELNRVLNPENEIERLLIGKMAAAHWRQIRLWEQERRGEETSGDLEMRLDRQFFRILDRYVRFREKNVFAVLNPPTG